MKKEQTASVHRMFNGPAFDLKWLLDKAERELRMVMDRECLDFWGNVANLSTTLAHMADWALHFKPSIFSSVKNIGEVRQLVSEKCYKASLFWDISNEYKHAHRRENTKSRITAQVLLYCSIFPKDGLPSGANDGKRFINYCVGKDGESTSVLTLKIVDGSGREFLFYDCAQEAINWWKSVIEE